VRIAKTVDDERIVIQLRRIGGCNGCMINESTRAWKGRWACLKFCSGRAMGLIWCRKLCMRHIFKSEILFFSPHDAYQVFSSSLLEFVSSVKGERR
jgi:hypothetical protein